MVPGSNYPAFTSDRYRSDILDLGISYVRFDIDRKRVLGVGGNDLNELLEKHDLHLPNGQVIKDGARAFMP